MIKKINALEKRNEEIKEKLYEFYDILKNNDGHSEVIIPPYLEKWANTIFKKHCGLTTNDSFICPTYWNKNGAIFKLYMTTRKPTNIYNYFEISLYSHNTEADTDMSDTIIMSIQFEVSDNLMFYHSLCFPM